MKKQLFPQEFINSSIEHYSFNINHKSSLLYKTILISCIICILSLPFVHTDVSINAYGSITPVEDKYTIQSAVFGRIKIENLDENTKIYEGDTLVVFDNSTIIDELQQLNRRIDILTMHISDLNKLAASSKKERINLYSQRYRLEKLEFLSNLGRLENLRKNNQKIFLRQENLFNDRVISEKEFELAKINFQKSLKEVELFIKQKKIQWQKSLIKLKNEKEQLLTQTARLKKNKQKYFILSPIDGTLQNTLPLKPNQYVQTGLKLAEISPSTNLIVTCWIPPVDIGLLKVGQKGIFRVDAYDFNDWGTINGEIISISNDVYFLDNKETAFKVQCKLDQNYLKLKNDFKGYLRKGMTLQSNFIVARRSLYQLLFDKTDNWLNPAKNNIASN